jgi:hypothetical protein
MVDQPAQALERGQRPEMQPKAYVDAVRAAPQATAS